MNTKPHGEGLRLYMHAGANEDLARAMIGLYNPLYPTFPLRKVEMDAVVDRDFIIVGFLYLFKGETDKAKMYLDLARSVSPLETRRDIQIVFEKWEDVCQIINSSKDAINALRLKRKLESLEKLLE